MSRPVNKLVVHYSATPEGREHDVRDIDRWHREKGWRMVGYHYVITLDGTVQTGRPEHMAGAHAYGHNSDSIGICYIGGTDAKGRSKNTLTDAQEESLIHLLKLLKRRYPTAEVVGHRDLSGAATECPGFNVSDWWASIQ